MLAAVMFYTVSLIIVRVLNTIEPGISPYAMLSMRSLSVCLLYSPFCFTKDKLIRPFE